MVQRSQGHMKSFLKELACELEKCLSQQKPQEMKQERELVLSSSRGLWCSVSVPLRGRRWNEYEGEQRITEAPGETVCQPSSPPGPLPDTNKQSRHFLHALQGVH